MSAVVATLPTWWYCSPSVEPKGWSNSVWCFSSLKEDLDTGLVFSYAYNSTWSFTRPPKRSHTLRYVLRNRKTGDLYLAVTFSLYLKEDVNEDGSLKPGTVEAQKKDSRSRMDPKHEDDHGKHDDNEPHDEDKSIEEARKKLGDVKVDDASRPDDVD